MALSPLSIHHGQVISIKEIPLLPMEEFREATFNEVALGGRIIAFFGKPVKDVVRLFMVLAHDHQGRLSIFSTDVKDEYPCLTTECPQAHWFEREIAEQWDILPQGHPWLKPIRFHAPYRSGVNVWQRTGKRKIVPGVTDFFQVAGDEIHEVAVGPVHAGIIEPGHFRFQCAGEHVYHLEISLGYQHRGVEQALLHGPNARTIHYMETLAGDTTIGHATAYCQAAEAMAHYETPVRAQALRGIMLELERLANHIGDLGALANDVGYLPTASYCGRLRGDLLNMTAIICGNRFGRGMMRPGGVAFDVDEAMIIDIQRKLKKAFKDTANAVNLLWDTPSVVERFEGTGIINKETAERLGLTGVVARACAIERDIRFDFPSGIYRFSQIPISSYAAGDVFARAYVRWLEIQRSVDFIEEQLRNLPHGEIGGACRAAAKDAFTVSLVEGWRGEICHVLLTDEKGMIEQYKIIDPSFHNWAGLAMAVQDEQVSNFPLCNKSFNLSYCGHDL